MSAHPEFVRGFEAGRIWARMDTEHHFETTIHAANTEMVMRMADAKGFRFEARELNDDWVHVELHR